LGPTPSSLSSSEVYLIGFWHRNGSSYLPLAYGKPFSAAVRKLADTASTMPI